MMNFFVLYNLIILFVGGSLYLCICKDKRESFSAGRIEASKKTIKHLLLNFVIAGQALSGIIYPIVSEKCSSGRWNTVFVISVFILLISILDIVMSVFRIIRKGKLESCPKSEVIEICFTPLNTEHFDRHSIGLLAAMTIAYAVLVFAGIGSTKAPETSMEFTTREKGNNELILDMGEEVYVQDLSIYLGHLFDRMVSVSYFDEKDSKWKVIDDEVEAEGVYGWNQVEIERKVRYIGIVSRNREAIFHEIVLTDKEGRTILPANSGDYQLLFDEQELYPETVTYYYNTIFDEVYYAGSAKEFLSGIMMLEQTHPPLGKFIIAIGELIFGVNPFGWRFMCAVAGILMVPLMAFFLYRLFENSTIALIGTALFCLDFMHFTLSRIATLDSIIAFFILAVFTSMLCLIRRAERERLGGLTKPSPVTFLQIIICAVISGAAAAVKWTGFYAIAGIIVIFVCYGIICFVKCHRNEKKPVYMRLLMLETGTVMAVISPVIYTLSFLPQKISTKAASLIEVMWNSSLWMFKFHENIVFEHPYRSDWYTWGLDWMPLVDSATVFPDKEISEVVTMGNPIIWWTGLLALGYMLYRTIVKRDRRAGFLCAGYLAMLVPWIFIRRTVFIYQYYGSSLFLYGMIAYALYGLRKKSDKLIPLFLEASLFAFILFYPVISGMKINSYHVGIFLEWLRSWEFV